MDEHDDKYDDEEDSPGAAKVIVLSLVGLGFLGAVGGGLAFVMGAMNSVPPPQEPVIQEISLVQPPPPPPPPPDQEEPPPPEPEMEEAEIPEQEPMEEVAEETPSDEPPPGADLGIDAEGTGAGDAFGLVGKKGGRSLIGGGGGSRMAWYKGVIQRDLTDFLQQIDDVKSKDYSITLKLWIGSDGSVDRTELLGTTGDSGIDDAIRFALAGSFRLSESPPDDLPQPVRLKIRSRI